MTFKRIREKTVDEWLAQAFPTGIMESGNFYLEEKCNQVAEVA